MLTTLEEEYLAAVAAFVNAWLWRGVDETMLLNGLAWGASKVLAQQMIAARHLADDIEQAVRVYGDLIRELTHENIQWLDEGH
jgi:hypothetical protein